ncbi:MAG: zinc ribbon domain-containing protein [Polyangiaceae bacterium]
MPTYEYACSSCGHKWEDFQKISADPAKECPNCHQQTAQRQISGGNFILKGGGWYADLYSSSSKKSASGEKSGEKSEKPSGSADTSAASKPAEKSGEKSGGGETKSETKSAAPPPATTPSSGKSD